MTLASKHAIEAPTCAIGAVFRRSYAKQEEDFGGDRVYTATDLRTLQYPAQYLLLMLLHHGCRYFRHERGDKHFKSFCLSLSLRKVSRSA
jgi:hypothetical protein